jgi:hypothetical protein
MDLAQLRNRLNQEFSSFTFGRARFPLLFRTGIDDSTVHSAGVSYLLGLGIELGLSAIAEYPVITHADEQWKKSSKVMPDSIWFHPQTKQPWIAFEFERFEKGDELKIQDKVQNLALSYYQSRETIELCVLIYWLRSGIAPRAIDPLRKIFEQGFSTKGIVVAAPKCSLSLYKFVFCQASSSSGTENLKIKDERGPYIVNGDGAGKLTICSATKVQ